MTLIVILAIYVWFMIVTLITAPIPSLLGVLLTSTGLIYYYRAAISELVPRLTAARTLRLAVR